jgi:fructose/tagatose bisphosphate aldolase
MPLATARPLHRDARRRQAGGYAISPVNVTASTTLNAAIRGLLTARLSDGIVQDEIAEEVSYGGARMNLDRDAQACRQLGSSRRSLTGHAPGPGRA